MDLKRQASAPLYEAIEKFRKKRIVPVSYTHLEEVAKKAMKPLTRMLELAK